MPVLLPSDFISQMKDILQDDFPDFEKAMQSPPAVSVRFNPAKSPPSLDLNSEVKWAEDAYFLKERPIFTADPSFHAGSYYVQESSSMFLEQILKANVDFSKPIKVLDLCAAPGGKTTHLASLLHPDSLIISNEIHPKRYPALVHNVAKWGMANVWTTRAQPKEFEGLQGFFDVVLIDAPCSGEGMMRKDEFAVAQWSSQLVLQCAGMQKDIISQAIPLLKEAGLLIFSSCTFNTLENEGNMQYLAEHGFGSAQPVSGFPEVVRTEIENMIGYKFFPHKVAGEGFFITAMVKNQVELELNQKKLAADPMWSPSKNAAVVLPFLNNSEFHFLEKAGEDIFAIRSSHMDDWSRVKKLITNMQPSLKMGTMKGKNFIPHAHLAWSTEMASDIPSIELDKEEALEFLRRNNIFKPGDETGWNLVKYENNHLGWIKNLGNRWNNYYPAEYRILHH